CPPYCQKPKSGSCSLNPSAAESNTSWQVTKWKAPLSAAMAKSTWVGKVMLLRVKREPGCRAPHATDHQDTAMQCIVIHQYGPASDVLKIENIDIPEPHKNEVLIRQHATSVNPIDYRMRNGYGRVMLSKMRGFELPLILGRDVAGEVVKVGPRVTGLRVGDAVFGVPSPKAQGAYAE